MKRLHLISAMYASKGHGFEYIRNFCENLGGQFEIILHIASEKGIEIPSNIEVHYTGINYNKTDAHNYVKYSRFGPYFRAIVKQYFSYRYYKEIIIAGGIHNEDLVYIMDYDVVPLTFFIKSLRKKGISRIFLWIHSAKFQSKDVLYSLYKKLFKFVFNRKILQNIHGVVVNGEYIKSEILKFLRLPEERIHVIQYPSKIPYEIIPKALARKKLGLNQDENIVLFFGMLRKDKNIEYTIESVSKAVSSPKLIIAGSEASVTKKEINIWLAKHKLKNYLLDIDYISEEKMALYYSCSDLLILTYELESGSQSGPLSLAREFELPALVTNTGEIGKYVDENKVGLTANPKIKGQFSDIIDKFFDYSTGQIKSMGESLKIARNKYSWEAASLKYRKLFNG